MKIMSDPQLVLAAMKENGFDRSLKEHSDQICIFEYDRQELLMSPLQHNEYLFFLLSGSVLFYLLEESGRIVSMARTEHRIILGEEKIFDTTPETTYVEARTPVRVLAVPYALCRREWEHNIAFLQMMVQRMIEKSHFEHEVPASADTIRDKFIFYITYLCPEHRMRSVNEAAETINCSCRQLHRVLNELTEEGFLCHEGKGRYRKVEPAAAG